MKERELRRPFIKALFRNNIFNLIMTILSALLMSIATLAISWLIKQVVDLISGDSDYSFEVLGYVAASAFAICGICWILDKRFLTVFLTKAMKQYRDYAFDKLIEKGIQSFSKEGTSLYISALSSDALVIEQDFIGKIQNAIIVVVSFIGALVLMIIYSPLLTLVSIGFSLIPIVASIILGDSAAKAEKNVSDKKESYTGMIKDVLTGFAVIKSFKAEKNVSLIHANMNKEVNRASRKRMSVLVHVGYASSIAGGILQIGVFFVACALALSGKGNITAGTALVFVQLLNYIIAPIQTLPSFYAGCKASFALIDKLAGALNKNVTEEGERIEPILNKGIFVRNLNFSYIEDKPVLDGINMSFKKGGAYALVGASGSGKSTLLNLLMASSRDYQGEILYDDKELMKVSPESLYDLVSIIQQNVFVFNSTIKDNITMFKDFPSEEVDEAINLSGLRKLINEKGSDYLCGENGCELSGGERQRISIARALLRKTPVLYIDEATAALDAETSFEVLDAILNLDGYTRIIVTHDLEENILRRCTRLFVLKSGAISEEGTFEELIDEKGYFYSLFTVSQR